VRENWRICHSTRRGKPVKSFFRGNDITKRRGGPAGIAAKVKADHTTTGRSPIALVEIRAVKGGKLGGESFGAGEAAGISIREQLGREKTLIWEIHRGFSLWSSTSVSFVPSSGYQRRKTGGIVKNRGSQRNQENKKKRKGRSRTGKIGGIATSRNL